MNRKLFALMTALVLIFTLSLAKRATRADSITVVDSTTDVSDGDTSSVANLIADPGPDGVISLREAIEAANNTPGSDTVAFNIPTSDPDYNASTGVWTIQPADALPTLIDDGTVIDGYTQLGAMPATDTTSATLKLEIDGTNVSGFNNYGFRMMSDGNAVKGLVINRVSGFGIYIFGGDGNIVSGNYIGTDASGTASLGNEIGVSMGYGAQNNTVGGSTSGERNVISGNDAGVIISERDSMSNTVSGNYIGTDASGTADLGNTLMGVDISGGARYNSVGGDTAGERNIISGNDASGIFITGSGTTTNTVSGNYIGTDVTGTADVGNVNGVYILYGAQNNMVGGDMPGERNIISGNDNMAVGIQDSGTTGNIVSGNYIGTDASGTADLGKDDYGVRILHGAQNNTIGGDTSGERNVISGHNYDGVYIYNSGTMSNTVSGNYIGTDASGTAALGNLYGVRVSRGAKNNTIGGGTVGERNVISGNGNDGVYISSNGTTGNIVRGNYIGTDFSGTADLSNGAHGVTIGYGAQNNTVGPDNVLAHNSWGGVEVTDDSAIGNIITRNSIFSNDVGIGLKGGANGGIVAPIIVITTVGPVNIVGAACAGCTVEVFENSDTDGEGETYIGSITADASGNFTLAVSSLSDPYLTATATDVVSGTSEFSAVFPPAATGGSVYLPVVLNNY
jgi:hypothetical protein